MADDRVRFPFGESQEGGVDPLLDSQELSGAGAVFAPGGELPRSSGSDAAAGPSELEPISAEGDVEQDRLVASDPAWRKLDATDERELDIDDGLLRSQTLPPPPRVDRALTPPSPGVRGVDRDAPTLEDKDGDGRREAPTDTGPVEPPVPSIPEWMRAEALAPATGGVRPSARVAVDRAPPPAESSVYESGEGPAVGWAPDFSAPPKGGPAPKGAPPKGGPAPKGAPPKGAPPKGGPAPKGAPPKGGPAPKGAPPKGGTPPAGVPRPPAPKGAPPQGGPAPKGGAPPAGVPRPPAKGGTPAMGIPRPPAPPQGGTPAAGAPRPHAPPKGGTPPAGVPRPAPKGGTPPKREPTPVTGWATAPGMPFEPSEEGPPIARPGERSEPKVERAAPSPGARVESGAHADTHAGGGRGGGPIARLGERSEPKVERAAPSPGARVESGAHAGTHAGGPIAPSTPSGRHVGPAPGTIARAPLWSQAVPAAAAPATPSGRHVAPLAGTTPHEAAWSQALPAAGGRTPSGRIGAPPAPPTPPASMPAGTPAAPLAGPAATTETIIVPLDDSGDGPTSPPAQPTPASELPTNLDVEADPEKTQPESLDELGSLETSGSGTGSAMGSASGEAPRGLSAGATDELRWPEGPSQRLKLEPAPSAASARVGGASGAKPGAASARIGGTSGAKPGAASARVGGASGAKPGAASGASGRAPSAPPPTDGAPSDVGTLAPGYLADARTVAPGYLADARTVAPGYAPAPGGEPSEAAPILDPGSGIGEVDGSSEIRGQLPFESSRLAKAAQDFDLDSELGRRTAELQAPDLSTLQGRRSALWEDSDLTPLPALEGSAEGPVEGLLDSQIGVVEPDEAPAPGGPAPSLRLVQASVERVVGLWEGEALWIGISLAGALVGPLFVLIGWDYYHLPKPDRALHALHAALKPGGSLGLVFGISGAVLFLLNLTYVLRRRFGLVKSLVSLRMWLNVHFICGITGGSLILVHSALLANNLVARFSSAAIGVAIASGIFGRYVLSRLPRRRDGENADLADRADVAARLTDLRRQLRTRLEGQEQLRDATLAALQDDAEPERPPAKGIFFLVPLVLGDIASFVRWWRLSRRLKGMARGTKDPQVRKVVNEALALARVKRLEVRLAQYDAVRDLMDTWRGVHLVVALVVIATMALHVVLVLQYGVLRPFGR